MNKDHSAFLAVVRQYVKENTEVAAYVSDFVAQGIAAAHSDAMQRAADMEAALAVAIAARYKGRDELILSKLNKWKDKSALNWQSTIEMLEKRTP